MTSINIRVDGGGVSGHGRLHSQRIVTLRREKPTTETLSTRRARSTSRTLVDVTALAVPLRSFIAHILNFLPAPTRKSAYQRHWVGKMHTDVGNSRLIHWHFDPFQTPARFVSEPESRRPLIGRG